MPDLTPSAVATLCDALAAGQIGSYSGGSYLELLPDAGEILVTPDPRRYSIQHPIPTTEIWSVHHLTSDLADVWRARAPTWAQPALDGLAVSMPVGVTALAGGDDAQGDLWGPR